MMSGQNSKPVRSRKERALAAGVAGCLIGAIGGALIGASLAGGDGAARGAFLGTVLLGPAEALSDAFRKPGTAKPAFYRMVMKCLEGAVWASALVLLFAGIEIFTLGIIVGFLVGAMSFRLWSILIGILIGGITAFLSAAYLPSLNPALLGGLIGLLYHPANHVLLRNHEYVQMMAERVPKAEVRYVVPFEANSAYIGTDYFKDLARAESGVFKRNPAGIGIVESMESMRGPQFDPGLVHPRIRDFYEHTSNYKLDIMPEWDLRYKPLFWIFKRYIAQPIGQANLPFNMEESQKGVVSFIDTIDFDCDDIVNLRGWVRAFEQSGEAIYVGIYTTVQYEDVGYVSVGFPLPAANFTATLLPQNLQGSNFLLTTRKTGYTFTGHFLAFSEGDNLSVLRLPTFDEEIEVFVKEDALYTQHRFYLAHLNFLTLHYTMDRIKT
ncbi:MAG: hypothetical protein JSV42_02560 [Chloroflexota bacterium]|nr:MAG: hypothetical protein JSV42_02560 [Chloroflexota bacterium]